MSDLDRLLAQVEELKRLALRPDDSWMANMSHDELVSLGKRVRKVADGLSNMQGQLTKQSGGAGHRPLGTSPGVAQRSASGSLGNMVRKDTGATVGNQSWTPPAQPASQPAAQNPFGVNQGADMSSPMRRRVGGSPAAPPTATPSQQLPPAYYKPGAPGFNKPPATKDDTPPRGRSRFGF